MIYKGQVRHRDQGRRGTSKHGKFYVPSFVVIEWQTPSENTRFGSAVAAAQNRKVCVLSIPTAHVYRTSD